MIFVRSRRPSLLLGAGALLMAGICVTAAVQLSGRLPDLAFVAGACSAFAGAVGSLSLVASRRPPPARLGLFRDRLVVVHRRAELHAPWEQIRIATVATAATADAPRVMGDSLRLRLSAGGRDRTLVLRPAEFGLSPDACRDMILRLRDDEELRSTLPDFDSVLDLQRTPSERQRPPAPRTLSER